MMLSHHTYLTIDKSHYWARHNWMPWSCLLNDLY